MTGPAAANGAQVIVRSSNGGVASAPRSLTIPAGATSTAFPIVTTAVSVPTPVTITVTAGQVTQSLTLMVTPPDLSYFTLYPSSLTGGQASTYNYVYLTANAGSAGLGITVISSNPAAVKVANFTIPAGAKTGTFPISTSAVTSPTFVQITVTAGAVTKSLTITVAPAALSYFTLYPTMISSGQSSLYNYVYLSGAAGAQGMPVTVTSSNPTVAAVSSFTISAGLTLGSFPIATSSVTTAVPRLDFGNRGRGHEDGVSCGKTLTACRWTGAFRQRPLVATGPGAEWVAFAIPAATSVEHPTGACQPCLPLRLRVSAVNTTCSTMKYVGSEATLKLAVDRLSAVRREIAKVIVGQEDVVEGVLICLLAGGHVLLEGVPGLGKTTLLRTLARTLQLKYSRIQFTPDLMPADIVGSMIIEGDDRGAKSLRFQPGPIFANLVLADEINRATPKTQSALLEAMQERTVTSGTMTHELDQPFLVMATQNPIEMEGTYPLPEAQLDRFLMKILVTYPSHAELNRIVERTIQSTNGVAHCGGGPRRHPRSALGLPRSAGGAACPGIRHPIGHGHPAGAEGSARDGWKVYPLWQLAARRAGAGGMRARAGADARPLPPVRGRRADGSLPPCCGTASSSTSTPMPTARRPRPFSRPSSKR